MYTVRFTSIAMVLALAIGASVPRAQSNAKEIMSEKAGRTGQAS